MKVVNLSETNSVLNQFLKRNPFGGYSEDSMRFRRDMERMGEIMAYEINGTGLQAR